MPQIPQKPLKPHGPAGLRRKPRGEWVSGPLVLLICRLIEVALYGIRVALHVVHQAVPTEAEIQVVVIVLGVL